MSSKPARPQAHAAQTTLPRSQPDYARLVVRTDRVLPPLNPARETFDEVELQKLIDSVKALGILQDLITEIEGDNFRVHAGHRRLVVAQALELAEIPIRAYQPGRVPAEAVKAHENAAREALNAAQEARHFGRLLESECHSDVDELCSLVKLNRGYVETRLVLLRGDAKVLEALGASAITLGVAGELNRVKNPGQRLMFLDAAMQGGASVRMVRDWRIKSEAIDGFADQALEPAALAGVAVQEVPVFRMECFLCDGDDRPYDMEVIYAHRGCRRLLLDRFLDQLKGTAPQ